MESGVVKRDLVIGDITKELGIVVRTQERRG
jgi:hypothetical protein